MTSKTDAAVAACQRAVVGLTGEQVAEVAVGLIGVALFRAQAEAGPLAAAETASSISGVTSSLGLDFRRTAARAKK